jgi:hypothetical protein
MSKALTKGRRAHLSRWLGAAGTWLVVVGALGGGCGDEFSAAPTQPQGLPCDDASDCPGLDSGCQQRSCVSGFCNLANLEPGAPCDGGKCNGVGECVVCLGDDDCQGDDVCLQGECVPLTCTNQMQDGDETDVDCGGACPGCANDQHCNEGLDCQSGFCDNGTCAPCQGPLSCPEGMFCKNGVCEDKQPNGQVCGNEAICLSGNCVDGVCCDKTCDGPCVSCIQAESGICGAVNAGDADPLCPAQDPGSCGTTGQCGPAGHCAFHGPSTPCGTCTDATTWGTGNCDGMGQCMPNQTDSCAPYVCGDDGCLESCATPQDCSTLLCDVPSMTCLGCGSDVPAPGGQCPSNVCTGGCSSNTCTIDCSMGTACQGNTIACPAGFDCIVECNAPSACNLKTITCPPQHSCQVDCTANIACQGATINCGASGVCDLSCSDIGGACQSTNVLCGSNACTATCVNPATSGTPNVTCGASCNCTPC